MAPKTKPLEGDAFRDNANSGPRASHSIPEGGLFSIYAEADIRASPRTIYDTLLAVKQYKEWNSFIRDVQITKHPHAHDPSLKMEQGSYMVFTCQMTPEETSPNRMTCHYLEDLRTRDDGHRSHQKSGNITRIRLLLDNANLLTPGWVFKSEWTHEIEEHDDGITRFRTWSVFAGLGAKFMRKKYEEVLKARYQEMCEDLKAKCEGTPQKPRTAPNAIKTSTQVNMLPGSVEQHTA